MGVSFVKGIQGGDKTYIKVSGFCLSAPVTWQLLHDICLSHGNCLSRTHLLAKDNVYDHKAYGSCSL